MISFAESRRAAGRTPAGTFVPLDQQDTALWNQELLLEGEKAIWLAGKHERPGRFQLKAAIQSVHAHRHRSGQTDWRAIHHMYATLTRLYPSVGATIGYAASFASMGRPRDGLAILDGLNEAEMARHQPYWAVRAHLLRRTGDSTGANAALDRAIGLSQDPAVRAWLLATREPA